MTDSILEHQYRQHEDYFGSGPDELLTLSANLIDAAKPVLDIGAGQGRHAIYLARQHYKVQALEPVAEACRFISQHSDESRLEIDIRQQEFSTFSAKRSSYSAILIFGLIPLLTWDKITELLKKTASWIAPVGLLFVTAFTIKDPAFARHSRKWKMCGKNSFTSPEGEVRTYLETDELKNLLSAYKVVRYRENWGAEHHHGDGPLHRHHWAEGLFEVQ